ncbi:MAG: amidohydrolase family protein, partial [Anaerolineales bacterium]
MGLKLIRSGTLVTESESYVSDVLIDGEKIVEIGENLDAPDAQVFDASGKLVMPGGIDPHTHFDLPMFDTVSSDD